MTDRAKKFREYVIAHSESQIYKDALLEWEYIDRAVVKRKSVACPCLRLITWVSYYLNVKTGCIIATGSKCEKEFCKKSGTGGGGGDDDERDFGEQIFTDRVLDNEYYETALYDHFKTKIEKEKKNKFKYVAILDKLVDERNMEFLRPLWKQLQVMFKTRINAELEKALEKAVLAERAELERVKRDKWIADAELERERERLKRAKWILDEPLREIARIELAAEQNRLKLVRDAEQNRLKLLRESAAEIELERMRFKVAHNSEKIITAFKMVNKNFRKQNELELKERRSQLAAFEKIRFGT